jgi:hypothetical protein
VLCSTGVRVHVFTEHWKVPFAALDEVRLRPHDVPLILRQVLKGFAEILKTLWEKPFPVNDRLMGFTQHDEVKVWLNVNAALNEPEEDYSRVYGGELLMLRDILTAVYSHTDVPVPTLAAKTLQEAFWELQGQAP